MEDLFAAAAASRAPLAERMRPRSLDEFIGQQHLVGEGKLLRRAIMTDSLTSSIFFGPPGCGKTTLASVIAQTTNSDFVRINAVSTGVKEMRAIIDQAQTNLKLYGRATYVMLDECHRWTKAQSDTILPALESGTIRFIGSTTENPMIAMTAAIVSRCRVFQFYPLKPEDLICAIHRALLDERGFAGVPVELMPGTAEHWANIANGDARAALNALELAVGSTAPEKDGVIRITMEIAQESIQRRALNVDDETFYNMLSAFCKSLRGSDADAALAWFSRMIYAGVDPRIIARRVIAHASEDVGLANPNAMVQAVAAAQALEMIGMPEARLPLAQAIIYVCQSPKSNAVVMAVDSAMADVSRFPEEPVPMHLRDTSYSGAKKLGNGTGYRYPHDFPGHYIEQEYGPPSVKGRHYYVPGTLGQEKNIRAQMIARGQLEEE
ncbi:MAG: replication-associated recombination protein A [Clostridia bacterium]|nr:replication-associated recombination protein A [Clostridia bacterium]